MLLSGSRKGFKSYLLSSFFGAAMIAATYAYFNYTFSRFHFIDFKKEIFYTNNDIFYPRLDSYTVVIYSSKKEDFSFIKKKIKTDKKILVIDLDKNRQKAKNNIIFITSNINTLLPIINRFKIFSVPVVFDIKKIKNFNYKQNSKIQILQ
jgi:hypothetical protein